MATWDEIGSEISGAHRSPYDVVRRTYLANLSDHTGRNIISYYSAFNEKPDLVQRSPVDFSINDGDKNGFMAAIYGMDRDQGLDLLLHTPGGGIAATESLVSYLRAMFDINIRVIVPQMAMSAGTMIACASREILMGKQSSLGPIDPQLGGIPAHGVIEEFDRAADEIKHRPERIPLWQVIISQYHPTFIGECENAIAWSNEMVKEWLETGMFRDYTDREIRADRVVAELGDHALTKSHDRHIPIDRVRSLGLFVSAFEDDDELQNAILSVHHATTHTLAGTGATKIIENHMGRSYIQQVA